ncbi:MAG TPA: hypothetical protein VL633_02650, partial [Bacteroidota bacterium]|nr:hypothetical protein [Bacteroidota bacterium]
QMTDGSRITIISNRLFEEIHRAGEAAMLSEILLTHSSDTRSVRFDQAGKMIREGSPVETAGSKDDDE